MAKPAHLAFPWSENDRPWPSQGQWTYDDYARLPDDGRRYEVIRGDLHVTPAPRPIHQFVVSQLCRLLGNFGVETGLGLALGAPIDVLLPDGIAAPVQPDIVFFRKGNQPRWEENNFQGVPDLVIEVESPSTRTRDRTIKLEAYQDARVPEYWRVSFNPSMVTVHALDTGARYVEAGRYAAGETVRSSILPGLAIPVNALFPFPPA
jgi:Uma2 family endonuclease